MKILITLLAVSIVSQSSFALDCYGTEPFWGAKVTDSQITLDINDNKDQVLPITNVSSVHGYVLDFVKIMSDSRGPVAIVKSADCNDGMSDKEFSQEIILFVPTGALYGCCGLPTEASEEKN